MRQSLFVVSAGLLLLAGCGKSEDEMRRLMREEIGRSAARTFYTDAQVIGPYSPAVKAGSLLFVSGQIGLDPVSMEFAGDEVETQTRQALTNLMGILKKAGYDSSDVVQCTVYLRDMRNFQRMNLIYGGFFADGAYPARTTVEVSSLPKDAKVEIAAIAVK